MSEITEPIDWYDMEEQELGRRFRKAIQQGGGISGRGISGEATNDDLDIIRTFTSFLIVIPYPIFDTDEVKDAFIELACVIREKMAESREEK